MGEFTINTDKMVDILKNDQPVSLGAIDDKGKTKLIMLFALPHLESEIRTFTDSLLKKYPKAKQQ